MDSEVKLIASRQESGVCLKSFYCLRLLSLFCFTYDNRDAADKVVERKGKFEELVVASNEIAASTAQLVCITTHHL